MDATGAARLVAKVYRQGIDPGEEVLQRVRDADPDHVVQVHAFGEDGGRWWELMEYVEQGSLRMLIEREGPQLPDALVMDILGELNEALAGLHRLDMEHRDLKPGNVLVRSRSPLQLVLTDFGITSALDATEHFTKRAGTRRYAPPELGTGIVTRTKWDYWSLGMVLVEMLTGKHPFADVDETTASHRLATESTDYLVEDVADPHWRELCRGLLRRTPSDRWDSDAVSKWLADPEDPSLTVSEEGAPAGAQPTTPTIDFAGASHATPAALGLAMSKEWERAVSFWQRRYSDIVTWVTDSLGLDELGQALQQLDDSEVSLDAQVFSLTYLLAPDAPLRFLDEDISKEGMIVLAERVNGADQAAKDTILAMYRSQIATLAAGLPQADGLGEVARAWDEVVQEYERRGLELDALGVRLPELDDDGLALLLAASIPGNPHIDALRAQAVEASTPDARLCDWFRDLGAPDEMSVAVLAMVPGLRAPAEAVGREVRAQVRRTVRRACIGGGIVGGMLAPFGYWDGNPQSGAFLLVAVAFAAGAAWSWARGGSTLMTPRTCFVIGIAYLLSSLVVRWVWDDVGIDVVATPAVLVRQGLESMLGPLTQMPLIVLALHAALGVLIGYGIGRQRRLVP